MVEDLRILTNLVLKTCFVSTGRKTLRPWSSEENKLPSLRILFSASLLKKKKSVLQINLCYLFITLTQISFHYLEKLKNISYKLYGWPQNIFVCLFCVCFIKRGFSVALEFVLVHSVIQADPSAFAS